MDRRPQTLHSVIEAPEGRNQLASSSGFYLDRTFAIASQTASMNIGGSSQ